MRTWKEKTMHAGAYQPIRDLLAQGAYRVEAWGNSSDGWQAYLVDDAGIGLAISPIFHRDFGDTLRDMKAAAGRAYGIEAAAVKRGRSWN